MLHTEKNICIECHIERKIIASPCFYLFNKTKQHYCSKTNTNLTRKKTYKITYMQTTWLSISHKVFLGKIMIYRQTIIIIILGSKETGKLAKHFYLIWQKAESFSDGKWSVSRDSWCRNSLPIFSSLCSHAGSDIFPLWRTDCKK